MLIHKNKVIVRPTIGALDSSLSFSSQTRFIFDFSFSWFLFFRTCYDSVGQSMPQKKLWKRLYKRYRRERGGEFTALSVYHDRLLYHRIFLSSYLILSYLISSHLVLSYLISLSYIVCNYLKTRF